MNIDYHTLTFLAGMLALLFSAYNYIKDPQEKLDKKQAVDETFISGRNALLEQQVSLDRDATNKRFMDMQKSIDAALLLAANHTHTIDVKVDGLTAKVNEMAVGIGKLETIIDERIPKKVV